MHLRIVARMKTKLLLSREEAAKTLGISLRKLEYLITDQRIPIKRIGRRVLISSRALEEFVKGNHP